MNKNNTLLIIIASLFVIVLSGLVTFILLKEKSTNLIEQSVTTEIVNCPIGFIYDTNSKNCIDTQDPTESIIVCPPAYTYDLATKTCKLQPPELNTENQ